MFNKINSLMASAWAMGSTQNIQFELQPRLSYVVSPVSTLEPKRKRKGKHAKKVAKRKQTYASRKHNRQRRKRGLYA